MSAQSELVARLKADGGVTALVSNRITPFPAPVNQIDPYIVYSLGTGLYINLIDSGKNHKSNRIQIDCWSGSYKTAQDVADAVETALNGYGYIQLRSEDYDDEVNEHRVILDWSRITL